MESIEGRATQRTRAVATTMPVWRERQVRLGTSGSSSISLTTELIPGWEGEV